MKLIFNTLAVFRSQSASDINLHQLSELAHCNDGLGVCLLEIQIPISIVPLWPPVSTYCLGVKATVSRCSPALLNQYKADFEVLKYISKTELIIIRFFWNKNVNVLKVIMIIW